MKTEDFGIGNRTIEFRAWDCGEMKYFDLDLLEDRKAGISDENFNSVVNCQVMQYTGLKDKSGKKIFEGDILDFHKGIVNFEQGCFGIEYKDRFNETTSCELVFQNRECEVIGNIFENKELLTANPSAL
uniref:YopX protein domain-containing protein n=1 Tax=uncultured marine virus TaxID=186617 RepID=A0A0F7L3Z5_9VIRU|nr:hypothetical protein [uncultured marine virus]